LPPLWLPVKDTGNPRPGLLTLLSTPRALRLSVLGLGLLLIPAYLLPAQEIVLRFTAPPPNRPVAGETRVALEASVPDGAHIVRIEVSIDSQRVAVLDKPPYEFVWNAGEEFHPHTLVAKAEYSNGQSATVTLETPPLRIGQRESVSLVDLYLNVVDAKNRPLTDLAQDDFKVFEDGKPQTIVRFTAARQPLSVALLIDASNSMGTGARMETARRAAVDFVKKMLATDQAMVFSFSDKVALLQPLTSNRKQLERAIQTIAPAGGTALYDAMVRVSETMKELEGRKAAILLSDGRDQAFRENAPGSLHLFEEAVNSVVRSEVVVYVIALGARLEDETDLGQRRSLKEILQTFSEKTGGRFYNPEHPGQLAGVYQQITEDLGRQYSLSYSPTSQSRDGRWRTITVEVRISGSRVLTRPGYFAPSP
jgi:Ca-activated chloride channel homolog